jgi:hypothetical protein
MYVAHSCGILVHVPLMVRIVCRAVNAPLALKLYNLMCIIWRCVVLLLVMLLLVMLLLVMLLLVMLLLVMYRRAILVELDDLWIDTLA